MSSDNITLCVIIALKCCAVIAALSFAFLLLKEGRSGWGWFVFAAICLAPGGIKID